MQLRWQIGIYEMSILDGPSRISTDASHTGVTPYRRKFREGLHPRALLPMLCTPTLEKGEVNGGGEAQIIPNSRLRRCSIEPFGLVREDLWQSVPRSRRIRKDFENFAMPAKFI